MKFLQRGSAPVLKSFSNGIPLSGLGSFAAPGSFATQYSTLGCCTHLFHPHTLNVCLFLIEVRGV